MPKFRYSLDSGATWVVVDAGFPYSIPSQAGDTVMVEPIGPSATSAAWFLYDTFTTGTTKLATAHTGETGHTWLNSSISSGVNVTVGTTGTTYNTTTLAGLVVSTAVVTDPDYSVEGVFLIRSNIATTTSAVVGRASSTDSEFYGMLYDQSGVIQLVRAAAGGARTVLASYPYTPTLNVEFTMRVIMNGNQISGELNGAPIVGPVVDNTITRAGRVGYRIFGGTSSATTGPHISRIAARMI